MIATALEMVNYRVNEEDINNRYRDYYHSLKQTKMLPVYDTITGTDIEERKKIRVSVTTTKTQKICKRSIYNSIDGEHWRFHSKFPNLKPSKTIIRYNYDNEIVDDSDNNIQVLQEQRKPGEYSDSDTDEKGNLIQKKMQCNQSIQKSLVNE